MTKKIKIVLSGLGTVGTEFLKLIKEANKKIKEDFNIDIIITGVIGSKDYIYDGDGVDTDLLLKLGKGSKALMQYNYVKGTNLNNRDKYKGDVLVEATPTDITSGQPGIDIILQAIEKNMNIVSISKGALVTNFKKIKNRAKEYNVRVKYSGATAAALPTMDVGEYSLVGTRINYIEGILNGTTNYILSRMHEDNLSFHDALDEAKERGIAETNSQLDIKGIDSASKLLLLSNSLLDTDYGLEDIKIVGIDNISKEKIIKAINENKEIKFIAKAYRQSNVVKLQVKPTEIEKGHLLENVRGTNKGIIFNTNTMGEIAILGGASSPKGAAAAAIKDIINLYR